jgi:hypothetical protein
MERRKMLTILWLENKVRDHVEDLRVAEKIILKLILGK